ncbi:hypothetical protein EON67_04885, partial [archaeon]
MRRAGMDSSVVATAYPGLYNISTTDFFYPLVEDPYLQVRPPRAPRRSCRFPCRRLRSPRHAYAPACLCARMR